MSFDPSSVFKMQISSEFSLRSLIRFVALCVVGSSMSGIAGLYSQGKVAVLPAVDYAHPDQSHFNSRGYWERGVVGPTLDRTGWLGRTLDAVGVDDNPLQGVTVSWSMDPSLISHSAPVGTVYDPSSFGFDIPGVWTPDGFTAAYRESGRAIHSKGGRAAAKAYENAFKMVDMLAPIKAEGGADSLPPAPVPYPTDSDLGTTMRNTARILGAGLGTRVVCLSQGGFDTHNNQPENHAKILKEVSDSVTAFQADIQARGLADRVVVMIWSEFGRRPEDNDDNGTDHGAGGGLLLIGNKVNGGIRSEFPGLTNLDEDDNLKVTTEFRTVYASLLEGWMGVDAEAIAHRCRQIGRQLHSEIPFEPVAEQVEMFVAHGEAGRCPVTTVTDQQILLFADGRDDIEAGGFERRGERTGVLDDAPRIDLEFGGQRLLQRFPNNFLPALQRQIEAFATDAGL